MWRNVACLGRLFLLFLAAAAAAGGALAADTEIGGPTRVMGSSDSGAVDGTTGTSLRFNFPRGCAFDRAGNMYLSERWNHAVRKIAISADGATYTGNVFAGQLGAAGAADGTGTAAQFDQPGGLAINAAGTTMSRFRPVSPKIE